jgi:hypothetical protein
LKKATRVLVTFVLILAIASIGFANAAPRTLKQVNMLYSTSDNPEKWLPVAGNQVSNFKLKLDSSVDWYYLDIKFIKPTLEAGYYMFWLTSPPASDTAFWNYWDAKGVNSAATYPSWQWVMWHIIKDTVPAAYHIPMFALYSDGEGNYKLCDGLQKFAFGASQATLRVNGDYPAGTYVFTCNAAVDPTLVPMFNILDGKVMNIEFR